MNVNQLWRAVQNPVETYQRVQEWRAKEKFKCVVRINHPRMRFKGRCHRNMFGDPNFPTYYAFLGVPYAQPPVGKLRFQPPQPLTSDNRFARVRRAYKPGDICLQVGDFGDARYEGSEDCLYLNIYLPDKPKNMKEKRPVIVYIHGGGFERGSGDIAELMPDAIIRENLVVVTVNYRLHVFGFLNTGTEDCRGNAGLKDQTAALRWIKANIKRFRGDPNNVTITGHSAGATCVNLHMISPLSKGLFHKAIVMGGGIHCPWGYQGNAQRPIVLFSRAVGHNEIRNTLVETLMSESPLRLLAFTYKIILDTIRVEPQKTQVFCCPTLEKDVEGAFIPRDIDDLMRCAEPVPLIAGMTAGEGNMFTLGRGYEYQVERGRTDYNDIVKNDEEFLEFLKQNLRWSDESARQHMNTIRGWYFPELARLSREEIQDRLAQFNADIWFRRFYDNFKIGPSGETPTRFYVYKFSFLARAHAWRLTGCGRANVRIRDPIHGDDEAYVFCPQILTSNVSGGAFLPDVKKVIDNMCSRWANFCRTEIPDSEHEDIEWRPHTDGRPCYLNINNPSNLVRSRLNQVEWQRLNAILDSEPVVATPLPSPVHSIFDFLPPRPRNLEIEQQSTSELLTSTGSDYTLAGSQATDAFYSMESESEEEEE